MDQTKRSLVAMVLLFTAFFTSADVVKAKNKVINAPLFMARNTMAIEVSKVVKSDTATVLHVHAAYTPKQWISISGKSILTDNNGRRYALRGADGITPGKKFCMPESGVAEFRLIFDPVDTKAVTVDFSEGEAERGGWCIWGLRLDGAKTLPVPKLPVGMTVHKVDRVTPLPQPQPVYGTATVTGRLLDYRPEMHGKVNYSLTTVFHPMVYMGGSAKIAADGTFSFSLPVIGLSPVSIYFPLFGGSFSVYVEPGKTTEVCVNIGECSRRASKYHSGDKPFGTPLYVKGPLAAVVQETAMYADALNVTGYDFDIVDLSPAEFKEKIMKIRADKAAEWQRLPLSRATRELALLSADLKAYSALSGYAWERTYQSLQKGVITRDYANAFNDSLERSLPAGFIPRDIYARLNEPQMLLSPAHTDVVSERSDISKVSNALGTDKGIYFTETTALKLYKGVVNEFVPLTEEQKAVVATLPAAYQTMINKENDALLKSIEEQKSNAGYEICVVPETADSTVFDSIVARYRGKVVLVDVWETWCAPCRYAHEQMLPLKKEFAGKDIVFVYLASESSPEPTWKYMAASIPGCHYRLTARQHAALRRKFSIHGVPTYILVDREGKVATQSTGFGGVEYWRKEIDKVL